MSIKTRLLISIILGLALAIWSFLSANSTVQVIVNGVVRQTEIMDIVNIKFIIVTLIPTISIFMIASIFNIKNKNSKYLFFIFTLSFTIAIVLFLPIPYRTHGTFAETIYYGVGVAGILAFIFNFNIWLKKDSWL